MTKLEQIARAIEPGAFEQFNSLRTYCLRQGDSEEEAARTAEWAHGHDVRRALEKARAAVEAMQEPTEAMQKAGFLANRFDNKSPCEKPTCIARITMQADAAWSAMINSVLNERGG